MVPKTFVVRTRPSDCPVMLRECLTTDHHRGNNRFKLVMHGNRATLTGGECSRNGRMPNLIPIEEEGSAGSTQSCSPQSTFWNQAPGAKYILVSR